MLRMFDLMAAARRFPARSTGERFTLVVLVEHMGLTDEQWSAFPGAKTLAAETMQDEGTVRRHLKHFEEQGLITTLRRPAVEGRGSRAKLIVLQTDVLTNRASCAVEATTNRALGDDQPRTEGTTNRASEAIAPNKESPSEVPVEVAPSGASPRGTRVAEQFFITIEMHQWAHAHVPDVDLREQTSRFVDYWRGQPGQRGVKLDWAGTWRNWMRRANDDLHRGGRPARRGTLEQIQDLEFDDEGMLL